MIFILSFVFVLNFNIFIIDYNLVGLFWIDGIRIYEYIYWFWKFLNYDVMSLFFVDLNLVYYGKCFIFGREIFF